MTYGVTYEEYTAEWKPTVLCWLREEQMHQLWSKCIWPNHLSFNRLEGNLSLFLYRLYSTRGQCVHFKAGGEHCFCMVWPVVAVECVQVKLTVFNKISLHLYGEELWRLPSFHRLLRCRGETLHMLVVAVNLSIKVRNVWECALQRSLIKFQSEF